MDPDRITRVEEQLKWMAPRVERIEIKLDRIIEWRWKVWGVTAAVSVFCAAAFELMVEVVRHS